MGDSCLYCHWPIWYEMGEGLNVEVFGYHEICWEYKEANKPRFLPIDEFNYFHDRFVNAR